MEQFRKIPYKLMSRIRDNKKVFLFFKNLTERQYLQMSRIAIFRHEGSCDFLAFVRNAMRP